MGDQEMMTVKEIEGGFGVFVKEKPLQTPKKKTIVLESEALAHLVVNHKDLVKLINTAIDHVADRQDVSIQKIQKKIHSDLLCYRAAHPTSLVERQRCLWDPLIERFQLMSPNKISMSVGIIPKEQDQGVESALAGMLMKLTPLQLVIVGELTALYDSLILALLHFNQAVPVDQIWSAAILDEMYLMDTWGEDPELKKSLEARKTYQNLLDQVLKT